MKTFQLKQLDTNLFQFNDLDFDMDRLGLWTG